MRQFNREDYETARRMAESPLAQMGFGSPSDPVLQAYKLGADDCMTFVTKVANVFVPHGLKVPARGTTEMPMDYMQRFIGAN